MPSFIRKRRAILISALLAVFFCAVAAAWMLIWQPGAYDRESEQRMENARRAGRPTSLDDLIRLYPPPSDTEIPTEWQALFKSAQFSPAYRSQLDKLLSNGVWTLPPPPFRSLNTMFAPIESWMSGVSKYVSTEGLSALDVRNREKAFQALRSLVTLSHWADEHPRWSGRDAQSYAADGALGLAETLLSKQRLEPDELDRLRNLVNELDFSTQTIGKTIAAEVVFVCSTPKTSALDVAWHKRRAQTLRVGDKLIALARRQEPQAITEIVSLYYEAAARIQGGHARKQWLFWLPRKLGARPVSRANPDDSLTARATLRYLATLNLVARQRALNLAIAVEERRLSSGNLPPDLESVTQSLELLTDPVGRSRFLLIRNSSPHVQFEIATDRKEVAQQLLQLSPHNFPRMLHDWTLQKLTID